MSSHTRLNRALLSYGYRLLRYRMYIYVGMQQGELPLPVAAF